VLGAIIGDVVGSIYAFQPIRTKSFELLDPRARFTDDTILTAATSNVIAYYLQENKQLDFAAEMQEELLRIGWLYQSQEVAFSHRFSDWLFADEPKPYGSAGVTAASRVSSAGLMASSLAEAEELAQMAVAITHNLAEGIKGAQCVAGCVYLGKNGASKEEIRRYTLSKYELGFTLKDIRLRYNFVPTCPMSVPPAIEAFLESEDFEDALRNIISVGGSDSLAAITGSIAGSFYGVPEELAQQVLPYLDEEIQEDILE
jgi:ADP-ribosyl-[dinitrogen reductase] hydrolase